MNLPEDCRPTREHLKSFSNLFSTYLDSSFDLEADPEKRLYSPRAHCFCPICSWLMRTPHLRPRKVRSGDKKRARGMKRDALLALAAKKRVFVPDSGSASCSTTRNCASRSRSWPTRSICSSA